MKKIIHVNQHNIKCNSKNKCATKPVISVKTYKGNTYGSSVEIKGPCVIKYNPSKPLKCGAKVWIETTNNVIVDGNIEI
jgi:uncharacterized membrane protein